VFGLPAGHTSGPALTLPLGVQARVIANAHSLVVIDEAAVE
jgi:muramoyltetrapeptide carboxypeptidase LdcA involved in peptidoglycan recycling